MIRLVCRKFDSGIAQIRPASIFLALTKLSGGSLILREVKYGDAK
jgi:hypothetical protein